MCICTVSTNKDDVIFRALGGHVYLGFISTFVSVSIGFVISSCHALLWYHASKLSKIIAQKIHKFTFIEKSSFKQYWLNGFVNKQYLHY